MAYTGPVFLGTPLQGSYDSNFIYDTGSGYLITTSKNCTFCNTQYYDQEASTSAAQTNDTAVNLVYGSADVTGYLVEDVVCLDDSEKQDLCVADFAFLAVTEAAGL